VGAGLLAALALVGIMGCNKQPVAIVNGQRVTREEFITRLEQQAGERVLADLIARKMLEDAFAKSGLQLTDEEVNAEIDKVKQQAPDEQAWQAYLAQQGMTPEEFTSWVKFQMQVKKLAEKDVKLSDEELKKHFDQYRDLFNRPASVRLSEIVVTDKAKADQIRKQLSDPKVSFGALARQHSTSTMTRERSGQRPEEPLMQVSPPALRSVVASLQKGAVSQPINVEGDWYIVKVDDKQAEEKAVYDKVKDQVREHYMYTHAQSVQDIIEGMRQTAKVSIVDPKYQSMNKMFGPAPALPSFGEGQAPGASPEGGAAAPEAQAQPAEGQSHEGPCPPGHKH
jgi:foldase protein PrsA